MKTQAYPVIAIAGALLAGVCGCGSAVSSPTLSWHRCQGDYRCATLSVPLSYSDPAGTQIPISVMELVATRPHPIADIVLNPGGPGVSGVDFLKRYRDVFPASLRARFTLVSFDPRGVGSSEPLHCLTDHATIAYDASLNPPRTRQEIGDLVSGAKAFVRGCERRASTAFIASMSTANSARDMDRLRIALGESKLTYMGFSYGTYLGTVYAEMFPKRIRAMVLDGAIDPALDLETIDADQAAGFEMELHKFFAWCAMRWRWDGCFSSQPAKAFAALMGNFKRHPSIGGEPPGQVPVGYATAVSGVLSSLYRKDDWGTLATALRSAEHGDGSGLAAAAHGDAPPGLLSNTVSANFATWCADHPSLPTLRAFKTLAKRLADAAPDFGSFMAWADLPCLYWPVRPHAQTVAPARAPGAPPILVIGSTGDPATPYAWAKALARQLPRATLLTRRGPGHTAYKASDCVRRRVTRYLRTLRMPPAGTVCPDDVLVRYG